MDSFHRDAVLIAGVLFAGLGMIAWMLLRIKEIIEEQNRK